MNENSKQRTTAPLVHGRMVYRCEVCGRSWFMYLEKGIEEFGENHKPSPFMIACPYCDGWASDVSGIQKIPGGRYARLPGGYMYFANLEDRDCGVPMLYEDGIARSGTKILTADELDSVNGDQSIRRIMDELLEDMQKRTEEYIEAAVTMGLLADAKAESQDFMKAVRILAEQSTNSPEGVIGAIVNVLLGGYAKPGNTRRILNKLDLARIRERKKEQEKARTMERKSASRFRQYKDRERAWTTRKRTGQRRREWCGPWKEKKTTDMEDGAMRRKDVKTIITYFYGIPAQRRELNKERAELEDEYSGLRGMSMDGLPHSSTPGKPVEELAERVDARGVWGKLEAVAVKVHVLEADQEKIRDCLNAINGEYTRLISYRYRDKYSWVKIAVKLGITERTAKRWGERALDRLGEALEEVSMPDEILGRASRARV